jgi:hypothetical protein
MAIWASRFRYEGEDAEPEHQLVFGGELPPIEQLGRYALALCEPVLRRELLEEL